MRAAWAFTGIAVPFLWAVAVTVVGYGQFAAAATCFLLGGLTLLGTTAMWAWSKWPLSGRQIVIAIVLAMLAIGGPIIGIVWASKSAQAQSPPNINGNCNNFGNNNINCNTFNVAPPARNLDSPWGGPLKAQILRDLPHDKEISVTGLMGDTESADLAQQIFNFLKANGFKLKGEGIGLAVIIPPPHGLGFNSTTNDFVVGSK